MLFRSDFAELPLLAIQAIKELKAENDALRAESETLKAQQARFISKTDAQQSEISELREMLMSLQRQLGTQVSQVVANGQ